MMQESRLRRWHRLAGVGIALFLAVQAGSGLIMSLSHLLTEGSHISTEGAPEHTHFPISELAEAIHSGGDVLGALYRAMLGLVALWMAFSGTWIFLNIRARSRGKKGTSRA